MSGAYLLCRFYLATNLIQLISSMVLLDFSLTVKAETLIFISGCGPAIPSAKEGNQVLFIIW